MRKINTEDTFKAARLLRDTSIANDVMNAYSEGKKENADLEKIGFDVFMSILFSLSDGNNEKKFYDLIAGICEKKSEDIKNQSIKDTFEDIKQICIENDIFDFFKYASKLADKIKK